MSNINDLVLEIQSKIDIYKLQAENQDKKKEICYEGNTLSYANWILGLHKDESPNTIKTVYLYTNVCKKNDGMYEEYLLVRPDKEITEDGKTLRTHMKEKYKKDEGELKDNKDLLTDGRTELNRLTEKLKVNETLRNDKVDTLKQIRDKVTTEQQELTDKKTIRKDEGLEDKLNEIKTELRDKEGELRDKEEQRDDIMNSLNTIITATPLPETNDDREDTVQDTNDDRDDTVQTTKGMEQDTNDDDQRIENIQGGVDDDDNAGPTNEELEKLNEELEKLNEELEPLQQEKTDLEEQFTQINNRIQEQELGIATLEQTITEELKSIQTLTQELTELNKQGVSINTDIERLDIVSKLEQKIEAHNENFDNKPNKLYEIKIKDFGNEHVKAISILNADYIDIGLLNEDVAYMVGKKPTELPTEDPVIISERDNTESTPFAQQPTLTGESISDSDSDTGSDNISIGDLDILTPDKQPLLLDKVDVDSDNLTLQENPAVISLNSDTAGESDFNIETSFFNEKPLLEEVDVDSDNLTLQENPAVISLNSDTAGESDFNIETSFFNEKPLLEEVPSDNLTLQEPPAVISLNSDSDSDSDSDSESDVNIKTSFFNEKPLLEEVDVDSDNLTLQEQLELPKDIINETSNILTQNQLEVPNEDEDGYNEEDFFHDTTPKLIEDLQFIEDQLKSYDDYKNIKDRTYEVVESIIKESMLEPLKELYINASIGDLPATLIITKLSNALKKKDINKFLSMISDMKTSINEYYNTTDNNEEILEQLVKKFRKYRGGSVKKQKTKKQKPLRKNNSFRKKRKAKV